MPSKKRKYEARFPPARIKKIMQTDEEIGKVAAAVPVIISRSLEIFLQSLVETTAQYTNERKAKTMTTSHLKHCIENEGKFDFLKDLVADIAEMANQEEEDGNEGGGEKPKRQRRPRAPAGERKRRRKSSDDEESDKSSDIEDKVINQPLPISSMTSSVPSASQQSSYSIDSIMGKSDLPHQPIQSSYLSQTSTPASINQRDEIFPKQQQQQQQQSYTQTSSNHFLSLNPLQGNTSSLPAMSALPMNMNLPTLQQPANDDEDDDYDV